MQEPEDPPIANQDPVPEIPQAAVAQAIEDPSSACRGASSVHNAC